MRNILCRVGLHKWGTPKPFRLTGEQADTWILLKCTRCRKRRVFP